MDLEDVAVVKYLLFMGFVAVMLAASYMDMTPGIASLAAVITLYALYRSCRTVFWYARHPSGHPEDVITLVRELVWGIFMTAVFLIVSFIGYAESPSFVLSMLVGLPVILTEARRPSVLFPFLLPFAVTLILCLDGVPAEETIPYLAASLLASTLSLRNRWFSLSPLILLPLDPARSVAYSLALTIYFLPVPPGELW